MPKKRLNANENQKLTDKEEKFCLEYALCLNGAKAARRAGYSERSAREIAHENLSKPHIKKRLRTLVNLTPERIINELAGIAIARLGEVVEVTPTSVTVKPSSEWNDRIKAGVKSIEFTETESKEKTTRTVKITMHDKIAALDKIIKLLKLYPSDMKLLEAVNVLMAEGLLSEEQAQVVSGGVEKITQDLICLGSDGSPFIENAE